MILDSNILIGYLNDDERIHISLQKWRENGTVLFISHVSVIESLSFSSLTDEQIVAIENFLSDFIIIPLDMNISRRAAELRRVHKLTLSDAVIVASARANNLPLVTRDKKMRSVPGIVLAEI